MNAFRFPVNRLFKFIDVGLVFGGDKNALRELKEENVMYIVETLSQNRNRPFDMQAVYECDDYVVYKVE